jgi:hypothetical protein
MDQVFCAAIEEDGTLFDPEQLELLWGEMGEERAEAFVRSALAEMARQIAALRASHSDNALRAMHNRAIEFAKLGDRVGMTRIAAVARDVAICARRGDRVALAATWARLDRMAEAALGDVHMPPSVGRSS